MSDEQPRELYLKEKIDRWMVNEGYRRLYEALNLNPGDLKLINCRFVLVFLILHIMVFVFGMMNYGLTVRNPSQA